ncbi:hypothetical protein IDSA_07250 [Pseudidiomarina salinarum]|uniref:4'-phosphopantetheinyl transferase N-terminal domain-containing protein n=1 Tax=Pseudidiomarina salinarum TaxID=435908 RepID=A0A094IT76_9GAMM|nr:hypothetical protein [Pseudidiomarina salinarum]KFZ30865.1 hypothetical protein IDSA_07250 [Pseudidiomarina salinarum]RUO71345.1 hypothetical protein CWI79_07935 [Pseudidiomarina salinarum]
MMTFTTDLQTLLPQLSPWLSETEAAHALTYQHPARQQQYQGGRALLRQLVCETHGYAPEQVHIRRQPNGAPLLQIAGVSWFCSISHTANAVAVAASPTQPLGIDIEQLKPRRRQDAIIKQYQNGFFVDIGPNDLEGFYQRWTLAEAVTKLEQGLLLKTLRRDPSNYLKKAEFQHQDHCLTCLYRP